MKTGARWFVLVFVFAIAAAAGAGVQLLAQRQEPFPHARHARLFPSCLGCHEGIPAGNRAAFYPQPALCAGCHDGVAEPRVNWRGPTVRITNLRFSHPAHDAKEEMDCGACHTPPGGARMDVRPPIAAQCLSCHAHRATDHFSDAACTTCHVPLATTPFTAARVSALPRPADHDRADFLAAVHGRLAASESARCSTCHTRELCTACHVNAGTLREAASIPAAQPTLGLPAFVARYFEPPSHLDAEWLRDHGRAARDIARCSTCHARESCLTCHRADPPRVIAALPRADSVRAPGVSTVMAAPPSHRTPFFEREHGALAATAAASCGSCHARRFCEDCHGNARKPATVPAVAVNTRAALEQQPSQQHPPRAPSRGNRAAFHLPNFMARHASAAYGRNLECASCHNTTVFCRDCHQQAGMRSAGRLGPGFHDAEPLWLLRHGQAARQGLESCASCHEQRNCTQCHSQTGAFQVNPHGNNFDAARAHARNPRVCLVCHLTDPIRRR